MLYGCTSSFIKTAWKAQHEFPGKYNKILVMGIIKDEDIALRRNVERLFIDDLKNIGYNAVSGLETYGPRGLANLGQEETYIKLRQNGIDAVITIALVDKRKEKYIKPRKGHEYASIYYFERIWNYPAIQAELVNGKNPENREFFWESILFDLNTLEPQHTLQTKSFKADLAESIIRDYGKEIISKMIKEKILVKQKN
jgi:hypothetical protein